MFSLDTLLHEAECLERGSRGDTISSISLGQIDFFFNKISSDFQSTLDGRLLLAQQGIDAARIENLLQEMQNQAKPSEKTDSFSTEQSKGIKKKYRPLNSLENFERIKFEKIEKSRNKYFQQISEFLKLKSADVNNSIDNSFKLFPNDITKFDEISKEALVFATRLTIRPDNTFDSFNQMIDDSLDALNQINNQGDPTHQLRIDFFTALKYILCQKELEKYDLSNLYNSPSILNCMIRGSLKFLSHQFLIKNFPNLENTTADEIEAYVASNYPNVQPPWPQIWFSLRGGLFKLAKYFIQKYDYETSELSENFDEWVVKNMRPPPEVLSHVIIETHPITDFDAFKSACYIFIFGQEIQQPPNSVLKNIEDFIFIMISPLRFNKKEKEAFDDYSTLNEIQNLIIEEGSKIFDKGNYKYVFSMILAIVFKFDECAKLLLQNCLFPIDVVHILMILKKSNLWNDPSISIAINEFVRFLPLSESSMIIQYLAFSENPKDLIDFLLLLDVNADIDINPDCDIGKKAIEIIKKENDSNPISFNTLHILTLVGDYMSACKVLFDLCSNDSNLSLNEAIKVIHIIINLINNLRSINTDSIIVHNVQKCGLHFSLISLTKGDQLTQNNRKQLLENVGEFLSLDWKEKDEFTEQFLESVKIAYSALEILILFDSGQTDLAISKLQENRILPLEAKDIDLNVKRLNENRFPSSSIFATTAIRALSYYLNSNVRRDKEKIQTLFDFCRRVQTFSDDVNKKLWILYERFSESEEIY